MGISREGLALAYVNGPKKCTNGVQIGKYIKIGMFKLRDSIVDDFFIFTKIAAIFYLVLYYITPVTRVTMGHIPPEPD